MELQYRQFYRVLHGWYNLGVFLVGSRTISCHPTSRGNIFFFYIGRPIHFGRLVLFFLVVVESEATPKSRRTAEAVCVTKFRNRMRKSVTFCRKCGRKIPPERSRNGWGLSAVPTSSRPPLCRRPFKRGATTAISFRLKIVYDGNSDRARSFAKNALCLVGCFF